MRSRGWPALIHETWLEDNRCVKTDLLREIEIPGALARIKSRFLTAADLMLQWAVAESPGGLEHFNPAILGPAAAHRGRARLQALCTASIRRCVGRIRSGCPSLPM